jgi:antitoxin YefM
MTVITISSLRKKMKAYFDRVSQFQDVLVIAQNNNADDNIVIISIKEYNSLVETEHLLSTETNRKKLYQSIEQLRQGNVKSLKI